jgi:hypothetical protein
MKLYSSIQDIVKIKERGFVVVTKIPEKEVRIRVGDGIQLRNPDGRVLNTKVSDIGHIKLLESRSDLFSWHLQFPPDIGLNDVPVGTEIWIVDGE